MAFHYKYETLAEIHAVVVFRGPAGGGRKTMCVDRGILLMQKRFQEDADVVMRLVFYPKDHKDFADLSDAIVVPFACIGSGTHRKIKSPSSGVRKGEVVLDLQSFVDTRIDGLERFTIWMHEDAHGPFCEIMMSQRAGNKN
jgi:hypothetical protein